MNVAIIAAAGRGSRFGGNRAKQFVELCGVPVIVRTMQCFEACPDIHQYLIVGPAGETAGILTLAERYGLRKLVRVVNGGETRLDSVRNGFQALRAATAEIVAVHDGARPFVTADEISRTIAAAREHGAAILTAPVTDTIKEAVDGTVTATLDRGKLRRALTPQCFRYEVLARGLARAGEIPGEVTDESMLVEALREPVRIVDGNPFNIKITHPEDIRWGEHLLGLMEAGD